jgi:tetratricopeptide (TPR) repeat protein
VTQRFFDPVARLERRVREPRPPRGDDAAHFHLRFDGRRAVLTLARPMRVGPALLEALTLDLGTLSAPIALEGGVERLRTRRSVATSHRIALDLGSLPSLAEARGLRLALVGVAAPARIRLLLTDGLGPLGVDVDVVAMGAVPALALAGVRAPAPGPSSCVARALGLLRAAGVVLDAHTGLLRVPDPVRLVLRDALAGRGFRVPRADAPLAPPWVSGDTLWLRTVDDLHDVGRSPPGDAASAADAARVRALRGASVLAALDAGDVDAAVAALGTHVPAWLQATLAVEAGLPRASALVASLGDDEAATAAALELQCACHGGDAELVARAVRRVSRAEPAAPLVAAASLTAASVLASSIRAAGSDDPTVHGLPPAAGGDVPIAVRLGGALLADAVTLAGDDPAVVRRAIGLAARLGAPAQLADALARCAQAAARASDGAAWLARLLLAHVDTPGFLRLAAPAAIVATSQPGRDPHWDALAMLCRYSKGSGTDATGTAAARDASGDAHPDRHTLGLDEIVARLLAEGDDATACALLVAAARDATGAGPATLEDVAANGAATRATPASATDDAERLSIARARVAQALRLAASVDVAVDRDALDALAAELALRAGDDTAAAAHFDAVGARPASPRRAPILAAAARFHLRRGDLAAARRAADAALRADPTSARARAAAADVDAAEASAHASSAGSLGALDAFALADVARGVPDVAPFVASVVAALSGSTVDASRATSLLAAARVALARPEVDEEARVAALRALAGAAAAAADRLHDVTDLVALEPFAPADDQRAELARRIATLLRGEGDAVGAARALARAGIVRRDLATLRAAIDLCERAGQTREALTIVDRALVIVGDGPARPVLLARAAALRDALGKSSSPEDGSVPGIPGSLASPAPVGDAAPAFGLDRDAPHDAAREGSRERSA